MTYTKPCAGKARLIFILEYDAITGGMVHSVTSLIKEIQHHFDIYIICPEGQLANTLTTLKVQVMPLKNVAYWHSKNPFTRLHLLLSLSRLINQHKTNKTVVITNNVYAQLLVAICSYFSRFKNVYFNRGGDLKNKISQLIIKLSSRLHLVIATSSNQKMIIQQSGLLNKGAKCRVLFNPIEKLPIEYDNQMNDDCFTLGVVGYIDTGKNQLLALESLSLLLKKGHNVQLCIYGEANNQAYMDEVMGKVKALALEKFVKFRGFIRDKTKIYSEIDLLLSTSIAEGFGRTLVEAMLEQKPVVALHCAGGPKDIITSEKYGQLVDNNAEAVTVAIDKFIIDKAYTHQVIEDAFNYAAQTFSPQTIAQQFITTIEEEVL